MRRSLARLLIPILCLFAALPAAGWAGNRALLIGIGEYRDDNIGRLNGADEDLALMKEALVLAGFRDEEIRTLLNREATLNAIRNEIEGWLIQGAGAGARLLLYISTHGTQVRDENGDEADGWDEALVAWDTRLILSGAERPGVENALLDDELHQLLRRTRGAETLVLVDACHSGTATKNLSVSGEMVKVLRYPGMPIRAKGFVVEGRDDPGGSGGRKFQGYAALTACDDSEEALATANGSYFTLAIHEAIRKNAGAADPLSLARLREHAEEYIHQNISSPARRHTPQLTGDPGLSNTDFFVRGKIWNQLIEVVENAEQPLSFSMNQQRFKIGDFLEISLRVPADGYLNILNVSPGDDRVTVLFPNRYRPENRVSAGERISIPDDSDDFDLRASKPFGRSLVVAVHSDTPVNAYRDAGQGAAVFRSLDPAEINPLFEVVPREKGGIRAGKRVALIEE